MANKILFEIEQLRKEIKELRLQTKEFYKVDELSIYLGLSESAIHKLTSKKLIRHFKPNGKTIFFMKSDVFKWITQNEVKAHEDLSKKIDSI